MGKTDKVIKSQWQKLWHYPWYVVVFSLYPALAYYLHNISQVSASELVYPTIISLSGVVILLLVLGLLYRDWWRAAALTLLVESIWFSHGYIAGWLQISKWWLIATWCLLVVAAVIAIHRWWLLHWQPSRVLNVAALALLTLVIAQIGWYWYLHPDALQPSVHATSNPRPTPATAVNKAGSPDIYYLVFDKYAGEQSLQQLYHYNNQSLLDQLAQRGFMINYQAYTNYPKTYLSLSSTLNMDYLDTLLGKSLPDAPPETEIAPLFADHKVADFLRDRGYTYVNVPSWFADTRDVVQPDVTILPQGKDFLLYNDFGKRFWATTLYPDLVSTISPQLAGNDFISAHGAWAAGQYADYHRALEVAGPKFVMMHILQPHPPFVFSANCQPIHQDIWGQAAIPYYLGQLECTNEHMLEIVDQIKAHSVNPIILIQADEGADSLTSDEQPRFSGSISDSQEILERTNILSAYYLPAKDGQAVAAPPAHLSPVNSFRFLFNTYFGTHYPLLPNKTYYFDDVQRLTGMHQVTDLVHTFESE